MRGRGRQLGWVVAALALLLLGTPVATAADQNVNAAGFTFNPATVTVNQGESVTWTNVSGFHNVHFDDNSFDQPPDVQLPPWTVSRTFNEAGSFRYYCEVHGLAGGIGMSGTVNVSAKDPGTSGPGTSGDGSGSPVIGQAAPGACASKRRFKIRLRGLAKLKVRSARVGFNGKQLPVDTEVIDGQRRHTALIDLRGLPGGTYTVAIEVTTAAGEVLRGTRTYRTCAGKLASSKLPRL